MARNSIRLIFGVWLALLLIGAVRVVQSDFYLQSDLMSLLPEADTNSVARTASEKLTQAMGDDFLFLLEADEPDALIKATQFLETFIERSAFMGQLDPRQQLEDQVAYTQMLAQYRTFLLTHEQVQRVQSAQPGELLNAAVASLYAPSAMSSLVPVAQDPLGLLAGYLTASQPELPAFSPVGNVMVMEREGRYYSLVHGRAVPGSFSLDAQEAMNRMQEALAAQLSQVDFPVQVYRSGGVFHGAQAAAAAKKEMTVIGVGSSVGIFLLFFYCFGSAKPLALSLSSVFFGCLAALIVCATVYGSLHLITLVFGASLIGVSVDYSLHYLTREAGAPIVPSIILAMLTSILGYGSLLQAPLPGLQEMALFSVVGLFSAGLFVLCIFPLFHKSGGHLFTASEAPSALRFFAKLPANLWGEGGSAKQRWLWLVLVILPCFVVVAKGSTDSNIRIFHTPDSELLDQQAAIEAILPRRAPNQFFLIKGSNPQALLQNVEAFKVPLEQLRSAQAISGYQLLSDALPSLSRQLETKALLNAGVYAPGADAERFFQRVGFDAGVAETFRQQNQQATPLTPDVWLAEAPEHLRSAWLGEVKGHYYALVLLESVFDVTPLRAKATADANVEFVDTVSAISNNLAKRFDSALRLLGAAYVVIAVLMLLRYRRLQALKLVFVPLVASLLAIAVLSLFSIAINVFHLFALFLVLGLGMDYGIFQFESAAKVAGCRLAILLSVVTSCLGFGLLALSNTPMISAFGVTVLLGSIANWLLVPLVAPLDRGETLEKIR